MCRGSFAVAVLCVLLGGCTAGNWDSIHRDFNLESNNSQLIDVKQRSILVSRGVTYQYDKDHPGTATAVSAPRVCAEPSPDALSAYATAVSGQGSTKAGDTLNFAASNNEQATEFGLRTQSIQLMRDAYYRACEARLGNTIDDETYDELIRRLNNQAIAYLAIEQITSNAAKATQVKVTAPDLGAVTAALVNAAADLKTATETRDKDKAAAADPALQTKPADLKIAQDQEAAAEAALTAKKQAFDQAFNNYNDAQKPSATVANTSTTSDPNATAAAVEAARAIALDIVNADYSTQMCFAHVRRSDGRGDRLADFCGRIFGVEEAALTASVDDQRASTQLKAQLATAINKYCNKKATKTSMDMCGKILAAVAGTPSKANPPPSPSQLKYQEE